MSADLNEIELKIYTGSIPRGLDSSGSEQRRLYEAIDEAASDGTPVTIIRYGKRLTLAPEDVSPEVCEACIDERHEDCAGECGCTQRTLHRRILAAQVALHRASRRR